LKSPAKLGRVRQIGKIANLDAQAKPSARKWRGQEPELILGGATIKKRRNLPVSALFLFVVSSANRKAQRSWDEFDNSRRKRELHAQAKGRAPLDGEAQDALSDSRSA